MLLLMSGGYSESESAINWIFLPGHHPSTPSPTTALLSHSSWSLPRSFGEISYSVKNCPSPGFQRQTFFISTSCPDVFGPGYWHRFVQEIGREEHLFNILSEKTFMTLHNNNKKGWFVVKFKPHVTVIINTTLFWSPQKKIIMGSQLKKQLIRLISWDCLILTGLKQNPSNIKNWGQNCLFSVPSYNWKKLMDSRFSVEKQPSYPFLPLRNIALDSDT